MITREPAILDHMNQGSQCTREPVDDISQKGDLNHKSNESHTHSKSDDWRIPSWITAQET